jgi:hypothetical protein
MLSKMLNNSFINKEFKLMIKYYMSFIKHIKAEIKNIFFI